MFYAERDEQGAIIAIRKATTGDTDVRPLSERELEEFLADHIGRRSYEMLLRAADRKMIRVLDDLIEVLVRKNVIMLTDLPSEAREKLGARQEVRRRLQEHEPEITVDDIL